MTAGVVAQQLVSGLGIGAIYGMLGLAFTICFGVLRVLNLAYGEIMMVGAVSGAAVVGPKASPTELALAILLGLIVSLVLGGLVHAVAIRPIGDVTDTRSPRHATALVATIGAGTVLQNGTRALLGPYPRPFPTLASGASISPFGVQVQLAPLVFAALLIVVGLSVWWLLHRTDFGLALRAVASEPQLASVSGIDIKAVEWRGVALSALLAGAAGLCASTLTGAAGPTMSASLGFKGLVVAVVAGLGRVRATIIAAFALGVTEAAAVSLFDSSYRDAVASGFLVVFLLVWPSDPEPGRIG